MDKFRENKFDNPWQEQDYGREYELEISMDIGDGEGYRKQGMVLDTEDLER